MINVNTEFYKKIRQDHCVKIQPFVLGEFQLLAIFKEMKFNTTLQKFFSLENFEKYTFPNFLD